MCKRGRVVSRSHNQPVATCPNSVSGFAGTARSIASSGVRVRVHTLAAARGAVALRKLPASAVRAVSSTVYVSRENEPMIRSFVSRAFVTVAGSRNRRSGNTGVLASSATALDRARSGLPTRLARRRARCDAMGNIFIDILRRRTASFGARIVP